GFSELTSWSGAPDFVNAGDPIMASCSGVRFVLGACVVLLFASPPAQCGFIVANARGAESFPGGDFISRKSGGKNVNVENLNVATVYTSAALVPIWDYVSNDNVTIDDMAMAPTGSIAVTITDQSLGVVGTIEFSGVVMGNSDAASHSL